MVIFSKIVIVLFVCVMNQTECIPYTQANSFIFYNVYILSFLISIVVLVLSIILKIKKKSIKKLIAIQCRPQNVM